MIRVELIMLIIIVLVSIFIAMAIIMVSLSVVANKSSRLLDEKIFKELKY